MSDQDQTPHAPSEPAKRKVIIEVTDEVLDRVDAWRAQQKDKLTREEAIGRLLIAHFWPNL